MPTSSRASTAGVAATESPPQETPRTARRKPRLRDRLLPQFLHEHGRTVYGGNPVVQQTLPGWFNYPSPFVLIPLFYLVAIPFVVVGACIVVQSGRQYIIEQPYSQIHQYQYTPTNPAVNVNQGVLSFTADGIEYSQGSVTWLEVNVTQRMVAPVYLYYKLDGYYQNFRDFRDGRSTPQLTGKTKLGSNYLCKPFTYPGFLSDHDETISITGPSGTTTKRASSFTYNPCGMAAWAMFNDSFILYRKAERGKGSSMSGETGTTPVDLVCNGTDFGLRGQRLTLSAAENPCEKKGISWRADREVRFHNLTLREDWWSLHYPYPTTNDYLKNGWYLNEAGHALPDPMDYDLQVWMRIAFRSSFRKLYRIIHVDLEPGIYLFRILELYDTVSFGGQKSIVLLTKSWAGSHNTPFGIVFIVIGCLSFVLGVAFTVEFVLQRNGIDRYESLPEPKRSWYTFHPDSTEFAKYYQLRLRRNVPIGELEALRKAREAQKAEVLEREMPREEF